jgi:oligoribonuclease
LSANIKNFVWIDLEMTGLDPLGNTILEIATVITTEDLEIVAEGPVIIINHPEEVLKKMDPWCTGMHTKTGLVQSVLSSPFSLQDAETMTLEFLKQHCYEKKSPLCGNSVWLDRFFLKFYMPQVYDFLFYRTIDVSTIKELIKRWYPNDPQINFKKQNTHRALDDIYESINELKYYKRHFFKASSMF